MSATAIVSRISEKSNQPNQFNPEIRVAGHTVAPSMFPGGRFASVSLEGFGTQHFTPTEALALAAALQAVAVHVMEQSEVRA